MQVNPESREFGEPIDLGEQKEEFQKKLEEMMKNGDIVALGPEDHLRALQNDLRKAGYKKMK